MTDIRSTIAPKSDQLNADDLIGQTKTIKVTKISLLATPEQPIAINFEGDGGKPYKPCKSMRRVLVMVWGDDGNKFIGRSMTLYRDDKVMFGGVATGGIRVSHMSDIDSPVTMALTATRANRKPFTVQPLVLPSIDAATAPDPADIAKAISSGNAAAQMSTMGPLQEFWGKLSPATKKAVGGAAKLAEWKKMVEANAKGDDNATE